MDNVGDALIRIKNGYSSGKISVPLKFSKLVVNLMALLQQEGFLQEVKLKDQELVVFLKYVERKPAISDIKRVSKPSLRIYKGASSLPFVLNGLGIAIISTPRGLMTDKQARKE